MDEDRPDQIGNGEHILGDEFKDKGYDPKAAPLYAQALIGMVAMTGTYWLDVQKPKRDEVAAHLVNLAWNGLSGLEPKPYLTTDHKARQKDLKAKAKEAAKEAKESARAARRVSPEPGTA